jgi:hypothetical protein
LTGKNVPHYITDCLTLVGPQSTKQTELEIESHGGIIISMGPKVSFVSCGEAQRCTGLTFEVQEGLDPIDVSAELSWRLAPSVVKFLKAAEHDYPGYDDNNHLFYYLEGLVSPEWLLFSLNENYDLEGSGGYQSRYLRLYHNTVFQGAGVM